MAGGQGRALGSGSIPDASALLIMSTPDIQKESCLIVWLFWVFY